MNVLVACEESQAVCKAFRAKGHRAFSCDIQECSGGHPEWHIQGDALAVINGKCTFTTEDGTYHRQNGKWDLLIAHPPCTYLSSVNNRHMSLRMNPPEKVKERTEKMMNAFDFFMRFVNADCEHIAIENPQGYVSRLYRKPDQTIHPYMFAESKDDIQNYQMKRTCLWLKGLPLLKRTNNLQQPEPVKTYISISGKVKRRYWEEDHAKATKDEIHKKDAVERSKTFPGIAKAMVEEWGSILDEQTEFEPIQLSLFD